MKRTLPTLIRNAGDMRLFLQFIANVQRLVHEDNLDACIVVTGYEGSGKSTFALLLSLLFEAPLDYQRLVDSEHTEEELARIVYEGLLKSNFSVTKQVAFDADHFLKLIISLVRGQVLLFDEAANGLLAREAMSMDNRVLTTAAMVARAKNLIWILCIPNFHNLDHYFRQFRVKIWIHIQTRGEAIFHIAKRNPYSEDVWWQIFMRVQFDRLAKSLWTPYETNKMDYIASKLAHSETRKKRKKEEIPDA